MARVITKAVESIISLAIWFFRIERSGLSILQEVFMWVRENRKSRKLLRLPEEVRKELAGAAAVLPIVG